MNNVNSLDTQQIDELYESALFRGFAHYVLRNLANKSPLKDPVLIVFYALDDVQIVIYRY
jgi:hypothetical protein